MEAVQADFHEIHYLSPHILTSFYTKDPPDQLKKPDSFYSNVVCLYITLLNSALPPSKLFFGKI